MIAIGLMSGTSLDGIDAALVELTPKGTTYGVQLRRFTTTPFDAHVQRALREALPPHRGTAREVAALGRAVGEAFARCAEEIAAGTPVDYAASHGLTLFHDGAAHMTLQIGDPFAIRDRLHASVCFDFRSADCAAGGHGAPLVPYVDALLLRSDAEDRVAVNLGGIANLTVLPKRGSVEDVFAFDSGPGNMLLDMFVQERTQGAHRFDRDGHYSRRGTVDGETLQAMLEDPYFALSPPKSTGREHFGKAFLDRHRARLQALNIEDGAATLAALTARTVADAIEQYAPGSHVFLSGGGAHNAGMVQLLAQLVPHCCVEGSEAMGIDPDAKEAIAFAVLGYETLRGRAANVLPATGAQEAVVLGAIAPYELRALLARVEAECRA